MKAYCSLFSLFFLFSSACFADEWFCKTQSSETFNNVVRACGVALGYSEANARNFAFDNAREEFINVCKMSSHCLHSVVERVSVGRTECEKTATGFKCWRLVEFYLE